MVFVKTEASFGSHSRGNRVFDVVVSPKIMEVAIYSNDRFPLGARLVPNDAGVTAFVAGVLLAIAGILLP